MCTYQIINILNRNATTRNLVGKLTVWLNILSQRCFKVGPSVKTVNIHVYTYIFLNKYLFDKMSTFKKKYVFHINIHISVFAMRG